MTASDGDSSVEASFDEPTDIAAAFDDNAKKKKMIQWQVMLAIFINSPVINLV